MIAFNNKNRKEPAFRVPIYQVKKKTGKEKMRRRRLSSL